MTLEDDIVVTATERLKSPGMWRWVVMYLSTFRTITLPSSSGSSSASIMNCPMIFRNVGSHSPPTTQRSTINTRFLCNTFGKSVHMLCHSILGDISVTKFNNCPTNATVFSLLYSVIQKDGLNFVSLYFKIRTSDKYDVNYIWLCSQWSL